MEIEEEEKIKEVILTPPLSLEGESNNRDYRAPNILQRLFSLFSNVGLGADLTNFQLPPLFNLPKSHLQCYGEPIYAVNKDMLGKCAKGETAVDRMIAVIAWSISTYRPFMFGVAPYNPILGETHHVSRGSLNVLIEQVSHHPPVSALYATDESNHLELLWCHHAVSKFLGASIETVLHGKRRLTLLQRKESYVMNTPKLLIRLFPKPKVEWAGNVQIECQETGLRAQYSYKGTSFFGFGGARSLKGNITHFNNSSKTLYEIDGQWDRSVRVKDTSDGKIKEIYNAKEVISSLPTPIVGDLEGVRESESAIVWTEVSKGILKQEWEKARDAKRCLEDKEREFLRQRKSKGLTWIPKHFHLSYTLENGWDCSPKEKTVPFAPILFPI